MLTEDMKRILAEQKIGYVATVNEDGTPNLSPKATFVLLDESTLIFGELRSPNTARNLRDRPSLEINFVDVYYRKGFRLKGEGVHHPKGSAEFDELLVHFEPWGTLADRLRGIVVVKLSRAIPVTSPAYDMGATEEELYDSWKSHYAKL